MQVTEIPPGSHQFCSQQVCNVNSGDECNLCLQCIICLVGGLVHPRSQAAETSCTIPAPRWPGSRGVHRNGVSLPASRECLQYVPFMRVRKAKWEPHKSNVLFRENILTSDPLKVSISSSLAFWIISFNWKLTKQQKMSVGWSVPFLRGQKALWLERPQNLDRFHRLWNASDLQVPVAVSVLWALDLSLQVD